MMPFFELHTPFEQIALKSIAYYRMMDMMLLAKRTIAAEKEQAVRPFPKTSCCFTFTFTIMSAWQRRYFNGDGDARQG